MVQLISIADCEFMDDPEPTARITGGYGAKTKPHW